MRGSIYGSVEVRGAWDYDLSICSLASPEHSAKTPSHLFLNTRLGQGMERLPLTAPSSITNRTVIASRLSIRVQVAHPCLAVEERIYMDRKSSTVWYISNVADGNMAMLDEPASGGGSKTRAWSTSVYAAGHWITIETNMTAFTSGPNCVVLALL